MSRTTRQFEAPQDLWAVVDKWVSDKGYRTVLGQGSDQRVFQRGHGWWVASQVLEIRKNGSRVELQMYVRAMLMARIFALFLIPGEMGIESGGIRMVLP
jgi:hypothetical protein